ncbi:serine hydrolase domain-containing protein [Microbulbifer magnicolonia]|uniref:serine hydrolase domain-containing protein n=1 Tax=Microbulbifer magnicolonia TaxID=3109744 RepID=UPI002B415DA3|nr:serine hydrolase domain-containing protein [Microbulbifer sp. GG15]
MVKRAFLCAALWLCGAQSVAASLDSLSDQFDREFRQKLEEAGIPGGAYAIVDGDQIVSARGYGLRAKNSQEEIDPHTVFRIASASKTFAAEVTGLVVRDGKLRWEDPVNRFLPGFRFRTQRASQALQVQHLIGQSSGLVPNAYDNLLEDDLPLQKILPRFRELEPHCTPGECYGYQNIVFSLVEPILEQVTGMPYAGLVTQRIFEPLDMHQSSVGMAAFLAADNRALPHIRKNGDWVTGEVNPSYYRVSPAAGVNASVTDLGKWLIAQMGYRQDVIPQPVIDEVTRARVRTLKELRRKAWKDHLQDAHYGLGWRIYRVQDEDLIYHGGWVQGYVADMAYSRERDIGLVVLLNAESSVISEITANFWIRLLNSGRETPAAV